MDLALSLRLKNIAAVATLAVLCGCSNHIVPITNFDNQPWPIAGQRLTPAQLSQRITQAANLQGWQVWPTGPNSLQAEFIKQTHHVTVAISFTQTSYSIDFVTSVDMDQANGKIHHKYSEWVERLRAAILSGVGQPA